MRRCAVIAILLLCFCSLPSTGQNPEVTGSELLHKMESKIRSDKDYALGYVSAVYASYLGTPGIPPDTEMKKVLKTAHKYLKHNREKLDQPAAPLLNQAFEQAYPKKTKS